MRTIIAGTRTGVTYEMVCDAVRLCGWKPTVVISGAAKGADTFGELWARNNRIPYLRFPADWATHGKAAGVLRNIQMADNADALIAIWNGVSKGTAHMISVMTKRNLPIYVHRIGT